MCSIISEKQTKTSQIEEDEQPQEGLNSLAGHVTSHLYLKPAHTTGTLDKAVVLRRIRHRKRVNRVKSAVGALLGQRSASTSNTAAADGGETFGVCPRLIWADDAFAAP
ncbi:LPS-assembly protein LptD [Striga asiatica]|uniref:LPS-assembly protein LptD n=1 Tax=Striga asiatica TaxID=4170 RepID=A0A5A7PB82_STRAF|nr:LPS-assembly protein LptD [Striga asiatica]